MTVGKKQTKTRKKKVSEAKALERAEKYTPISVVASEEEVTVTFDVDICVYCGGYFHTTAQEVRPLYTQGPCSCVMCMTCDKRLLAGENRVMNKMGSFCLSCAFGFA